MLFSFRKPSSVARSVCAMLQSSNGLAPAFILFPSLKPPEKSLVFNQVVVLIVTFLAYASFHVSRKPPSIVKSILAPAVQINSSRIHEDFVAGGFNSSSLDIGWAPFNGPRGINRLGELDLAFLSFYSIGMYFSGHVGDKIDLRLFLVFGMIGSGLFTIVFGLGYWFEVHRLSYFVVTQILCGLFQSIGWPCVVAVVGNWFGKTKRGLIMGIWNSHTSFGNIIGSLVASGVLEYGWGWAFLVPGALVIFVGCLVFLLLVVHPEDIGFGTLAEEIEMDVNENGMVNLEEVEYEEAGLLKIENSNVLSAIGFFEAWRLPDVAPFSFSLFFSKLVAYTFLYWLPFYIRHTAIAGVHLSHKTAGILSTIFDVGGVAGGISAGYVSDIIGARAVTSVVFMLLSIPALVMYWACGSLSMSANISLMFISGLLVNGPYALITTSVAADLGTQDLIKGNSRALATVAAIIDGTGSIGAALGPLFAGYISTGGWNSVFIMLIVSILFACLLLIRVAVAEIKSIINSSWS